MNCPYCNVEYTEQSPCFCHPTVEAKAPEQLEAASDEEFAIAS